MLTLEQSEARRDRQPPKAEGEPRVVPVADDDVLPRVPLIAHENDVEAVVLVPARIVLLEAGKLADDADVREAGFLLELPKEAGLETLAFIEPPSGNLDADVRMLRILEDEELSPSVPVARDVGDDSAALHSSSSSACGR
jgi:hypothetical protein